MEGKTPFLISNAFLKGLKAVIDTDKETLYSRLLSRYFSLQKSSKNLFLMDINQLWEDEKAEAMNMTQDEFFQEHHLPLESKTNAGETGSCLPVNPSSVLNMHQEPEKNFLSVSNSSAACHSEVFDKSSMNMTISETVGSSVPQAITSCDSRIDCLHHGSLTEAQELPQCQRGDEHGGSTEVSSSDVSGRSGEGSDSVWQGQVRPDFQDRLRGREMDGLVCDNVRIQHQDRACQVHHLCQQTVGCRDCDRHQKVPERGAEEGFSTHHQQDLSKGGTRVGRSIRAQRVRADHGDIPECAAGGISVHRAGGESQSSRPNDPDRDGHPRAHHSCESTDAITVDAAPTNITDRQEQSLWAEPDDSLD